MTGREGEVMGSGDMAKAFFKADEYPDDAEPRYCYFRMFKDGPIKVWRLKGPLYGSRHLVGIHLNCGLSLLEIFY